LGITFSHSSDALMQFIHNASNNKLHTCQHSYTHSHATCFMLYESQ